MLTVIVAAYAVAVVYCALPAFDRPPFAQFNREMRLKIGIEFPVAVWWMLLIPMALVWSAPLPLTRSARWIRDRYIVWRLTRMFIREARRAGIKGKITVKTEIR